jgi:hypothetical protein
MTDQPWVEGGEVFPTPSAAVTEKVCAPGESPE